MKEWLLKEDAKNKVGRPKLADTDEIKKSKKMILFGLIIVFILGFMFISTMKNIKPYELLYNISLEKIFGKLENKDGFIVNNYYDKNKDYIIDVKVPLSVSKYQGSYKYTLYKLKNDIWVKKEEKTISRTKNEFKIKVLSKRNINTTWKIKLELVNAANVDKSFAPSSYTFVDSKDAKKYAYNVFTVKGFYSPVNNSDSSLNDNKISVTTPKNNPRKFIIDLKNNTGNLKVTYTDSTKKINTLDKLTKKGNIVSFVIPNSNKLTNIKISFKTNNDSDIKPNSWVKETKSDGIYYLGNYNLKPESSYKN